jgi:hypothetical protein
LHHGGGQRRRKIALTTRTGVVGMPMSHQGAGHR